EETRLFASSNGEMFLTSPQHQVLATFDGPEMLTEIKFGPRKQMIGVSSMDHSASLYELNEGAIDAKFHLREHNGILNDLAWSPDGRTVATASSDSSVRLWNVATGQRIFKLEPKKTAACLCVAFSLDGRYLAFGTAEGELVVIHAPLE
ncbi:MAG: hypothetical protein KDA84_05545, partial [Planctomycetaceae bacterium]|nr:hypothetical protein [Planctomycetaceae bacterium]